MKFASRVCLPLILLGAFALRLYRLGVASLWYDETVSTFLSQQNLVDLTRHTAGDIHPPLYYYLLHFWTQATGTSEFSFAFFSVFCGVLLIALTYRAAREWFDVRVGLIATLLVAISPYNLWYSQEVRMYTLGAVLGLASVYFLVRVLQRPTTDDRPPTAHSRFTFHVSRDFIAYAVVSALGLYTLYYFAFLLVFENLAALIWIALSYKSETLAPHASAGVINLKSEIALWIASQLATLILFLPWLPIAIHQAIDPPVPPWRSFPNLFAVLIESFSALAFGQSLDPELTWPILIFIAILLIIALARRNRSISSWFLFGYTFVPLAIIFVLSLWKPLYHVRYVFIYSPGFYILWALGFARLTEIKTNFSPYTTSILAGSLLLLAAIGYSDYNFWFDPKYGHDDLRSAVHYLADHVRPGDAILIDAGYTYTAFVYYFDQPIAWHGRLVDYPPTNISTGTLQRLVDLHAGSIVLQTGSIGGNVSLGWGSHESDFYATTADETRAALDRVFALHPRMWLFRLYDTVVDPTGVIRDYLARHGRIIDDEGFRGESFARVQGYLTTHEPTTTPPGDLTHRDILIGNRITLLGFAPASIQVQPSAPLDVDVYWQAKESTNIDEHLFVALYDQTGKLVASNDQVPVGNVLGTSRWSPGEILREPIRLIVPANLAPGDYNLRVTMYNPLTNEPLQAPAGEWVIENSQIRLTNVRVEK